MEAGMATDGLSPRDAPTSDHHGLIAGETRRGVPPTLGVLLKEYRLRAGLTQEQLAEQSGISPRALQYIEHGSRLPFADTVQRLATTLRLTAQERTRLLSSRTADSTQILPASPSAPLVGRAREIALLDQHLSGHGPPVLLLAGAPGIGKSRLLQEAAHRAGAKGLRVLVGGCTRSVGGQPFAPLLQGIQRRLAARSAAERRSDLHRCAWLIRLLPELAADEIEPLPSWTLPAEQERRLMFDAVRRFLANVAGPAGTLLVLDDLQWADVDALDLLNALLRSTSAPPLRVVGAYRGTEAAPASPISRFLVDLAEARLVAHQQLGPLADTEARELLRALFDGAVVDSSLFEHVVHRVGGIPFYLVSYARGPVEGNHGEIAHGIPWDVRQSIRGRIHMLSAEARLLLALTATAGGVVLRSVLLAAAAQPEETALLALDDACRAGLLDEVGEDAYGFVHDVIREVMEGELGLGRRRALHRQLATALAGLAGDPPIEALAYHYRESGERERAAIYLEQAGDRAAARYAYAGAEEWYRDLVDCLDALGRGEEASRAREKRGEALFLLARYDDALAVLDQTALRYLSSADLEGHLRVMARIGHAHAVRGTPEDGLRRIQQLPMSGASSVPPRALAALYVALAHLHYESGRFVEQLAAEEQAINLARDLGDDHILAAALGWRGLALANLGRFEEALHALAETSRLAESVGDLESLCQAQVHTGNLYLRGGDSARGRPYFERALSLAEQLGDPALLILILHFQGWFSICIGQWQAARRHLDRALDLSRRIGPSRATARLLLQLGALCTLEGAWVDATRYIEDALSLQAGNANRSLLEWATTLLAHQELRTGQPASARDRLLRVFASSDPTEEGPIEILAECYLDLGEISRAEALAARAVAICRTRDDRLDLLSSLQVQARVAIRKHDYERAVANLEEGLNLARSIPDPYAEGNLLRLYGTLYAEQGESAQAQARLHEALAIFHRLGARKDIERTEQVLAGLGFALE